MKRLFREVSAALGVPVPIEIERKFLVAPDFDPHGALPVPFQEIDIEQAYLFAPDGEALRVRKRGQNGSAVYYHTHKKQTRTVQWKWNGTSTSRNMRNCSPSATRHCASSEKNAIVSCGKSNILNWTHSLSRCQNSAFLKWRSPTHRAPCSCLRSFR